MLDTHIIHLCKNSTHVHSVLRIERYKWIDSFNLYHRNNLFQSQNAWSRVDFIHTLQKQSIFMWLLSASEKHTDFHDCTMSLITSDCLTKLSRALVIRTNSYRKQNNGISDAKLHSGKFSQQFWINFHSEIKALEILHYAWFMYTFYQKSSRSTRAVRRTMHTNKNQQYI